MCRETKSKVGTYLPGVVTYSITSHGSLTNLTMLERVVCHFNKQDLKAFDIHPRTNQIILILIDICYVITMIRNAFFHKREFID